MQWRYHSLALNHWYIPENTCIIILQFIHIVEVEILFLPVYIHDLKQDNSIVIPKVLEIPVVCSKNKFINGYLKNECLLTSFDSTTKIAVPYMVGNDIQRD